MPPWNPTKLSNRPGVFKKCATCGGESLDRRVQQRHGINTLCPTLATGATKTVVYSRRGSLPFHQNQYLMS